MQQDNARPHCHPDDPVVAAEGQRDGWNIILKNQPPNSPDLNVLDLGFFASIQSLQYKYAPRGIDELVTTVEDTFENMDHQTLNKVWLTLQTVMGSIMEAKGSNKYRIYHMNKDKLIREGTLPTSIECKQELLKATWDDLEDERGADDTRDDPFCLGTSNNPVELVAYDEDEQNDRAANGDGQKNDHADDDSSFNMMDELD